MALYVDDICEGVQLIDESVTFCVYPPVKGRHRLPEPNGFKKAHKVRVYWIADPPTKLQGVLWRPGEEPPRLVHTWTRTGYELRRFVYRDSFDEITSAYDWVFHSGDRFQLVD